MDHSVERPSSWPVRNARRHIAAAESSARMERMMQIVLQRLSQIEGKLDLVARSVPGSDCIESVADVARQCEVTRIDAKIANLAETTQAFIQESDSSMASLSNRLTSLTKLLMVAPMPHFHKIDDAIASCMGREGTAAAPCEPETDLSMTRCEHFDIMSSISGCEATSDFTTRDGLNDVDCSRRCTLSSCADSAPPGVLADGPPGLHADGPAAVADRQRFVFHIGSGSTSAASAVAMSEDGVEFTYVTGDKLGVSGTNIDLGHLERSLKAAVHEPGRHRIHCEGGQNVKERVRAKLKELEASDLKRGLDT